ncbi:VanZ family protein [Adlercreutzia murintestinalis]|uniref:VanZ family protein n=1 Tax=Adlercreutzia murintestinalis TaxID=2941325 RepID=UPI00203D379D|nr:VanZ family protein [Adlercreutzia murintestinalis]
MKNLLGSYSDNFAVALGLWPVASFILTLPILAYLYHRDGRIRFASAVATYLSVLYVLGLACFTLYPLPSGTEGPGLTYGVPPQLVPLTCLSDVAKDGLPAVFQIVANVVLFVPLGFIAGRLLRLRFVPTALLGLCTSLLVEIAQLTGFFGLYPYAYRMFDVDDLLTNTTGAVLGYALSVLAARVLPETVEDVPAKTSHPTLMRRGVALWIDSMIIGFGMVLIFLVGDLLIPLMGIHDVLAYYGDAAFEGLKVVGLVILIILTLVVEAVIPWLHGGSTPGGAFVRMSFETRPRTGWQRGLFYTLRLATLVLVALFPWMLFVLLAFYAVRRQMPYDLLPADPAMPTATTGGTTTAVVAAADAAGTVANAAVDTAADDDVGASRPYALGAKASETTASDTRTLRQTAPDHQAAGQGESKEQNASHAQGALKPFASGPHHHRCALIAAAGLPGRSS